MELSEEELLEAIRKVLSGPAAEVIVGPGDDAAVVGATRGELVLTADMLVEGVHFSLATIGARDLGRKSIAVNVSDIAAMGGSPRYALVSLALSPSVDAAWMIELFGGMREAGDEYALSIVGGDLSRSQAVTISVALVGEVPIGRSVTRAGARAGDRVVVTGVLGASAGGLALASASPAAVGRSLSTAWAQRLLEAHLRPVARVGEGQALARAGAHAMMDVSDGFALDLSRLCRESGLGARIRSSELPVAPELAQLAEVLPEVDPLALALSGGEDYELLAAVDADLVDQVGARLREGYGVVLTDVGEFAADGLTIVDASGRERPLDIGGWDHFA